MKTIFVKIPQMSFHVLNQDNILLISINMEFDIIRLLDILLHSIRVGAAVVRIYSPFLTLYLIQRSLFYVSILPGRGSVFLFSPTKPSSPTKYHSQPFPLPNSKPFEIKIYRLRRFSTAHAIYRLRGFHPFLPSGVFL